MATMWTEVTGTSSSIPAGSSAVFELTISANVCDIGLLEITPSVAGGSMSLWICKRATCLSGDIVPPAIYNDTRSIVYYPITSPSGTPAETTEEAALWSYEDLDAVTKIHMRIFNNASVARTFAVKIHYRPVIGVWTSVTYNAGDFTADSGSWTVEAGDVASCAFCIIGKTMMIMFALLGTSVSATPYDLYINLPAGATVDKRADTIGRCSDNGSSPEAMLIWATAGETRIKLRRLSGSAWSVATNTTIVQGQVILAIQ